MYTSLGFNFPPKNRVCVRARVWTQGLTRAEQCCPQPFSFEPVFPGCPNRLLVCYLMHSSLYSWDISSIVGKVRMLCLDCLGKSWCGVLVTENIAFGFVFCQVTRADVDVQPYAFTTKSLFVGHMDYKYLRWQVRDSLVRKQNRGRPGAWFNRIWRFFFFFLRAEAYLHPGVHLVHSQWSAASSRDNSEVEGCFLCSH